MTAVAERALLVALLAYLLWIPLPFASVVDRAYVPLVVAPLAICAAAALARSSGVERAQITPAYRVWTIGALAFAVVVTAQLAPVPQSLLEVISPRAAVIWRDSARIAALARQAPPDHFTLSVNPAATRAELFRLLALIATFQAAALLITTSYRRIAFAATLGASALFQVLYGVREAALQRYAIWGWLNRKVFNRVTGTFVNPNHFAHYVGLVLPLAIFLCVLAWHEAGARETRWGRRVARVIERHAVLFGAGALLAVACFAGILLAQSRGALLSIFCGLAAGAFIAASVNRRRKRSSHAAPFRLAVTVGVALGVVLLALVGWLGLQRTVGRFVPQPGEELSLVGRLFGIEAAVGVWRRFPLFGSGFGTFPDVTTMAQRRAPDFLYTHAHNDYAEIAATTGSIGFLIAAVALVAGYRFLVQSLTTAANRFRRRAFVIAALTSMTAALVHALFDFNFFIPANAATLAAIAGSACALTVSRAEPSPVAAPDSESGG